MKIKKKQILLTIIFLIIFLFLAAFIQAAETEENSKISINLKNVELETALIMLANTAGKNLICDQSVEGEITVIFNEIEFESALSLITDSFNLSYKYQDQVIYISKKEEMPVEENIASKNYNLKHLNSEKAIEILENNFVELNIINLNSEGFIINSSENKLEEIDKIISQIDIPQKQVKISARVEEISRTRIKELGINPEQLSELKLITNNNNLNRLELSWPETLRILNEEGASNILANPSLMTLDRKKAKLIIGDQIPIKLENVVDDKTVSSLNYIEAGIVLEFLPKIINDNQILLELKPAVNSIGQILADGLPAVNSRSAETTVILENGQTLAIGGLIKKDELRTTKEIPLLADLPVLGALFSRKDSQDIETELVIFITPEIIESDFQKNNLMTVRENEVKNKSIEKEKKDLGRERENNINKEFVNLTREELEEILEK